MSKIKFLLTWLPKCKAQLMSSKHPQNEALSGDLVLFLFSVFCGRYKSWQELSDVQWFEKR